MENELETRKQNFKSLRTVEAELILEALEICQEDRLEAAKILGIGKTSIYRKLGKLGLSKKPKRIPNYEQVKQELLEQIDRGESIR